MNRTERRARAVTQDIGRQVAQRGRVLVAIDGRCASGKTTLAKALAAKCNANVFHTDDFLVPLSLRTPAHERIPGGILDAERLQKTLKALSETGRVMYTKFDCSTGSFVDEGELLATDVTIVEGAYALHPVLFGAYDIRIFCTASKRLQKKRILARNGKDAFYRFKTKWIPLENRYIRAFRIKKHCDYHFSFSRT